MIRDDMYVVYVADEQQTAIRLEQLMNVYSKELRLAATKPVIVSDPVTGGAAEKVGDIIFPESDSAKFPVLDFKVTPDDLLGLASQSDEHAVIEMWRKLPGISVATSKVLVDKYSINDVINLPVSEIRAITGTSGRKLSKSSADSLVTLNPTKLLSGIRNVTAATADIILQSIGDLKTLSTITEIELSNVQLQQKTRTIRLGNVRAARILFLMQYKNATTV